ncbi:MAG: hypothetical protein AAF766_05450 [Cyanobacteria bacterium P01_D01_bin.14]
MSNEYRLSPKNTVSAVLLSFVLVMGYVKLGALSGEDWARERLIERLFEERLFHKLHYGALTTLSEWFLLATVILCSSSARTLAKISGWHHKNALFLLASGSLLSLFLLDDAFRISLFLTSQIDYFKVLAYLAYGSLLIGYGVAFRNQLRETPYGSLVISILLLVVSGLADLTDFPQRPTPIAATAKLLLEDGTKICALVNLMLYFWQVCQKSIMDKIVFFEKYRTEFVND